MDARMWGPDYYKAQQDTFVQKGLLLPGEYLEYFCYNWEDTSIAAGTGTLFEDTNVRIDQDADFVALANVYSATDPNILVRFINEDTGQYLYNRACDVSSIAGSGIAGNTVGGQAEEYLYYACPLCCPMRINGGPIVTMQAADFNNSGTNALYFTMHGAKIRKGQAPWLQNYKRRSPFVYSDTVQVAANGAIPMNLPINQDADFAVYSITAWMDGNATILIKDGGSDRIWMDRAMRIRNMVGNGQKPHILEAPRMIYRGTGITVTLADLSGSANDIRLAFHGEKLFR